MSSARGFSTSSTSTSRERSHQHWQRTVFLRQGRFFVSCVTVRSPQALPCRTVALRAYTTGRFRVVEELHYVPPQHEQAAKQRAALVLGKLSSSSTPPLCAVRVDCSPGGNTDSAASCSEGEDEEDEEGDEEGEEEEEGVMDGHRPEQGSSWPVQIKGSRNAMLLVGPALGEADAGVILRKQQQQQHQQQQQAPAPTACQPQVHEAQTESSTASIPLQAALAASVWPEERVSMSCWQLALGTKWGSSVCRALNTLAAAAVTAVKRVACWGTGLKRAVSGTLAGAGEAAGVQIAAEAAAVAAAVAAAQQEEEAVKAASKAEAATEQRDAAAAAAAGDAAQRLVHISVFGYPAWGPDLGPVEVPV